MNVIIPPKRTDGGTSFVKLVSYVSQREDKPSGEDVLTDKPKSARSTSRKAEFDRLVDYIERTGTENAPVQVLKLFNDGSQRVRVGEVACETNAFSYETAAAEMNMVAAQNRHIKDPVYHFIISWREEDEPTDDQVFGSARHSLKKLGLEAHQFVTAIHRDTDNVHAHIAVNRVNPETFKAANMWNDVDTLQKCMRALEHHYGFKQDNGPWQLNDDYQLVRPGPRYPRAPQGAAKREIFSNKESLFQYAVDHVRKKVEEALRNKTATWKYLHLLLHANGLGLREQGEGLVIYDYLRPDDPVVKASSVHPGLTKARIEKSYGAFEGPPPFEMADPDEGSYGIYATYNPAFEARDKGVRAERREARANARDELNARYKAYRDGWEKPDLKVKERYQLVAAHCQAMKAEVRRTYPDPLLRKLMYRVAEFERMKATAALRIALREERQALAAQGLLRPLTYRPWVEQQALGGDVAAVSQLRGIAYREKRKKRLTVEQRNRTIFAGRADDTGLRNVNSHTTQLHRDGTIEYLRDGIVGVVDHGGRVEIKPGHMDYDDSANYRLAAHLASRKSGEWLEAVGDDEFLTRLFDAAVNMNRLAGSHAFLPTEPYQREQFVEFERDHRLYYGYGEPVQVPSRPARGPDPVEDVVIKPSSFPRP